MQTRVGLKYFMNNYLWKQFFAINSPQTPSNYIFFENFGNFKAFHTVLAEN